MTARTETGAWSFSGFGPEFDEHVAAHLPGYSDVQALVALIATHLVPDGGTVADIGASTGVTAATIADALPGRRIRFHLYDADPSMLEQAADRVPDAELHRVDLPDDPLAHGRADLTVALWFLQFLHPGRVPVMLAALHRSTRPGGALVVATKSRHPDSRWQEIADAALDDYKAAAGVDATARDAKRRSLRGTMHPVSADGLLLDLSRAGWVSPTVLWRWHVWTVIGAFRDRP